MEARLKGILHAHVEDGVDRQHITAAWGSCNCWLQIIVQFDVVNGEHRKRCCTVSSRGWYDSQAVATQTSQNTLADSCFRPAHDASWSVQSSVKPQQCLQTESPGHGNEGNLKTAQGPTVRLAMALSMKSIMPVSPITLCTCSLATLRDTHHPSYPCTHALTFMINAMNLFDDDDDDD